ncbi:MAG: hypothetical protein LBD93_04315 [Treponema sp.]|jgi:hypothetical protein|nr:hypothetical protein [Treponema sp.]
MEVKEPTMGLTFEQVWAMFQETDRKFQEMIKETDRKFQEMIKESDRKFQEMIKESDRKFQEMIKESDRKFQEIVKETNQQIKETNRAIGKLSNRFGELVEHLVSPHMKEKFNALIAGYRFTQTQTKVCYADHRGRTIAEVDVLLQNGEYVLAVEVKSNPTSDDVDEHVMQMGKVRGYADEHNDHRKYLGAIAGAIMSESMRVYAFKQGFYVLEQTGDTVSITAPPASWQAKIW